MNNISNKKIHSKPRRKYPNESKNYLDQNQFLMLYGPFIRKELQTSNSNLNFDQYLKVIIKKEKKQGCTIFGSCLIKGVSNKESPQWLKDKIKLFR